MMSVGSNFLCGRPHGADRPVPPSVRMLPLEPDPSSVWKVTNGWPLIGIISSS